MSLVRHTPRLIQLLCPYPLGHGNCSQITPTFLPRQGVVGHYFDRCTNQLDFINLTSVVPSFHWSIKFSSQIFSAHSVAMFVVRRHFGTNANAQIRTCHIVSHLAHPTHLIEWVHLYLTSLRASLSDKASEPTLAMFWAMSNKLRSTLLLTYNLYTRAYKELSISIQL